MPRATPMAASPATHRRTTSSCINRTSRPCSTGCGPPAPRCVGNTLLLNGRTYSPPYTITAIGDATAMQVSLAAAPLVILYKQYVVRFGLGYTEQVTPDVRVVGYTEPVRIHFAHPAGPLSY